MVVGIDVYHDNTRKCGSIAGVVTSLNDASTRYYSVAVEQKQGQEIMDALRIAFIEGLIKYWETNRRWPANIVVFRDGGNDFFNHDTRRCHIFFCNCNKSINPFIFYFLQRLPVGDGQLETTEKHEAEQFKRVFEHVRSSGESTLASATDVESRLSSRLSELMPADYNPGFAFVVVQKRINTRIVTVNKRMPRVRKKKKF